MASDIRLPFKRINRMMTIQEIKDSLDYRERNRLKANPFALAIALAKAVNADLLRCHTPNFHQFWPTYGPKGAKNRIVKRETFLPFAFTGKKY